MGNGEALVPGKGGCKRSCGKSVLGIGKRALGIGAEPEQVTRWILPLPLHFLDLSPKL